MIFSTPNEILGTATTMYIENSSLYCDTAALGSHLIEHTVITNSLYMNNTVLEGGGSSDCIHTNGVGARAGLINVTSNLANDAALASYYVASGFTQEVNLNVPK